MSSKTARKVVSAAFGLVLFCCGPSQTTGNQEGDTLALPTDTDKREVRRPNSIDSPLLALIDAGAEYDERLPHSLKAADYLMPPDKTAMTLGTYAADALYFALYNKTSEYMSYSTTCQRLGNDIGVREGFGAETARRLEKNAGNPDSVCAILNESIVRAREALESDGLARTATMIAVGGFIETLHLLCTTIQHYPQDLFPSEEERLRMFVPAFHAVLKQKENIPSLQDRLSNQDEDETVRWLKENLSQLKNALDAVAIDPKQPHDGFTGESLKGVNDLVKQIREYIAR